MPSLNITVRPTTPSPACPHNIGLNYDEVSPVLSNSGFTYKDPCALMFDLCYDILVSHDAGQTVRAQIAGFFEAVSDTVGSAARSFILSQDLNIPPGVVQVYPGVSLFTLLYMAGIIDENGNFTQLGSPPVLPSIPRTHPAPPAVPTIGPGEPSSYCQQALGGNFCLHNLKNNARLNFTADPVGGPQGVNGVVVNFIVAPISHPNLFPMACSYRYLQGEYSRAAGILRNVPGVGEAIETVAMPDWPV